MEWNMRKKSSHIQEVKLLETALDITRALCSPPSSFISYWLTNLNQVTYPWQNLEAETRNSLDLMAPTLTPRTLDSSVLSIVSRLSFLSWIQSSSLHAKHYFYLPRSHKRNKCSVSSLWCCCYLCISHIDYVGFVNDLLRKSVLTLIHNWVSTTTPTSS